MGETVPGLHILVLAPGQRPVETLERAIQQLGAERRVLHEIHVIASRPRLTALQRDLLNPGHGTRRFAALCAAAGFARDEILFNQRTLHPLDVDTTTDCSGGADRVLELLRGLSASDQVSLTLVVAEDAGATGHLLHACLQLVGRVSDRLLLDVSNSRLRGNERKARPPAWRHIEIPVLLWPAGEPQPSTYAEAVDHRRIERRRVAQPDPLRLDCRRRLVSVGETTLTLPAMQFFWLYYLASAPGEQFPLAELSHRSTERAPAHFTQKLSDGRTRVFPNDLQRAFAQLFPMATDKFEAMFGRCCGVHPGLPSTISKINAALRRALGRGAGPYLIQGGRGAGGYRITVPAVQILGVDPKRT